ncbi:MAG: thiamine phosphate synthase [Bacteroidetes bacterium]|nr:thiamine phosphate synthase [Bacteroidota bacterium]
MFSRLQYISQGKTADGQSQNIQQALEAGCAWIQLRFKNASLQELFPLAEKVKRMCENYKAVFMVNDYVQVAKAVDAHGVHLGITDDSPVDARKILGDKKLIGGTANTMADVMKRVEEKCDYIGLGPYRFTTTKEKLSPVLGLEGFEKIMSELKQKNIFIPVYAIGGITEQDIDPIMKSGVYGVAVSGTITAHNEKRKLVGQLKNLLHGQS